MRNESNRPRLLTSLAILLLSFAPVAPSVRAAGAPAAPAAVDPGDAALAERLAETARLTLSARYITNAHWKMAGALLEAATALNPKEPRYPRFWIEAELKADDDAAALRAVKA